MASYFLQYKYSKMRKNGQNKRINNRREQDIAIYCHFTPKFVQNTTKNGITLIKIPTAPPVFSITPPNNQRFDNTTQSPRSFVSSSHQKHIAATIIRSSSLFFLQKSPNTHCFRKNYAHIACFLQKTTKNTSNLYQICSPRLFFSKKPQNTHRIYSNSAHLAFLHNTGKYTSSQ